MDLHPARGKSLGSGSGCAPAAFSGARVWRIEDTWLSSLCKPTSRCSPVGGLLPSSQMKVGPVAAACALRFGRESRCPCRDVFGDDGVGPVIGSLLPACTTAASSPAPTRPAAAIHKKKVWRISATCWRSWELLRCREIRTADENKDKTG